MAGKITLIVGIVGMLLGGAALLITLILYVTGNGRISFDEAVLPMIGSCACSGLSLILAVVGVVLVMKARKNSAITSSAPPDPPIP